MRICSVPIAPGSMLSPKPTQRRSRRTCNDIAKSYVPLLFSLMANAVLFTEVFDLDDVVTHSKAGSSELGAGSSTMKKHGARSKEPEITKESQHDDPRI